MQKGDLVAELGGEQRQHLRGQGDLRHQNQCRPPLPQDGVDKADIDLSLAAAGHAVEQGTGRLAAVGQLLQPVQTALLLVVQLRRRS